MSVQSQSPTFTYSVNRGFFLCSTPLHRGLSDRPIRWRCLLRVLCPVRRPVTALDCVVLKDRNLDLAPRQGPIISSPACLWVSPRTCVLYKSFIRAKTKYMLYLKQNFTVRRPHAKLRTVTDKSTW